MTKTSEKLGRRARLNRRQVLETALDYVDQHGLEALSMHKLGAELGVKGMSLYNHVANKSDILDGIVDLLWTEIEAAAPAKADWRAGFRSVAHAVRDVVRRHPNAASLIMSQQVMPEPSLRLVQTHIAAATDDGTPKEYAYPLLRTIWSYALGSALAEVQWGYGGKCCHPQVSDLLRPGMAAELMGVAEIFCGQSDPDAQFDLGLDLMLKDDAPATG